MPPRHTLFGQSLECGSDADYAGDPDEGERFVQPVRAFGPPAADLIGPIPHPALQSMLDDSAPKDLQNDWKSAFVNDLDDSAIDVLVGQARGSSQWTSLTASVQPGVRWATPRARQPRLHRGAPESGSASPSTARRQCRQR
jgi:hypothetical protein